MRLKAMLAILVLTAAAWAQTSTPTAGTTAAPPTAAPADAKPQCPCCQKAAEGKAEMACCAHHDEAAASNKEAMSCSKGKDGKSCMKGDKGKSAEMACANGKCCGEGKMDCCGKADKDGKTMAMACCKGAGAHCGMGHQRQHGDMNK